MARMPDRDGWAALDRAHLWHPYTQMATAGPPVPIARAHGSYLYTEDGRAILDAISSWWVNLHGHNHPRLNRALREQAARLEQVIFAGFTHEPAARLAARLAAKAPPGLSRVFFSDDGSTAVESALKMAVQYWRNRGQPKRTLFIGLEGGYHGDTFGAMAAGGAAVFNEPFRPLLFKVLRAHSAYCYRCPVGKERASCRIECADRLEGLLEENEGRVAAVILEPMLQGAGGMIVAPREFLCRARESCDRHRVLLIADEVLTGFGRTGKMFACEHGPVAPDLLCLSKALTGGYLPLGATLCREEIYQAFLSPERSRAFLHGHSYTANPLACAVALESLAVLEEERGIERAVAVERIYRERLERLRGLSSVGDVRAIGMVAAVELVRDRGTRAAGGYLDEIGPRLARQFLERNILLRPLGNILYLLPPLSTTDSEIHGLFDAIEEVLAGLE
jgi:adenosylmethionine-8-amino-7-oxononanoate aminotransferase